jgi:uncharacterized protein YqiB (DUF1249 family)
MDEEYKNLQQLVASNAKAIEALTNAMSEQKEAFAAELAAEKEERQKERAQIYQFMADSLRQFLDLGRRVDNNTADIRELTIENQRILRYLESILNNNKTE